MAFRDALLALLSAGPRHGYQLKLDFEAATGAAWPLNVGQVYTTLQRLERDGMADVADTDREGRIVYRITPRGSDAVAGWLDSPVERPVTDREELSMKLLLSVAVGVGDPLGVVATQRRGTMAALQDYTRLRERTGEDELAWQLHLERLMIAAEAELRWLDRVEDRLARRPAATAPPSPLPTPDAADSAVNAGGAL